MCRSADVEPWIVSDAATVVESGSTAEGLGWKVLSLGAVPGGRV